MSRHIAIVSANHLDADTKLGEIVDRTFRVRLGRVGEDQKAAKGHPLLVFTTVVRLGRNSARRHSQDPESLYPLLQRPRQVRHAFGGERDIDGIALDQFTTIEHIRECTLVIMRCCVESPSSATTMVSRRRRKSYGISSILLTPCVVRPALLPFATMRHRADFRCRSRTTH